MNNHKLWKLGNKVVELKQILSPNDLDLSPEMFDFIDKLLDLVDQIRKAAYEDCKPSSFVSSRESLAVPDPLGPIMQESKKEKNDKGCTYSSIFFKPDDDSFYLGCWEIAEKINLKKSKEILKILEERIDELEQK